jgi:enoyl-[acyl-carrier protein] reductase I
MSFLNLNGKTFLLTGVANRRSVAWKVASLLKEEGANVIFSVHTEERKKSLEKLLDGAPCLVFDAEKDGDAKRLSKELSELNIRIDGLLHSMAFANYSEGVKPFHEASRKDFTQALQISAFSLVELSNALLPVMNQDASIVTVGISSLTVTPENYGIMGPAKSALRSNVRFLAKSLSSETRIRVNSVGSGPLKTNSSAGIPGYMENYLYAERLTFRKEALKTEEVASTITFLLSPASSGINGEEIIVDAGLGMNAFDSDVVKSAMRPES